MLDTVDPPIQQPKWKELTDLDVCLVSSIYWMFIALHINNSIFYPKWCASYLPDSTCIAVYGTLKNNVLVQIVNADVRDDTIR